jgi:hypothetical protein
VVTYGDGRAHRPDHRLNGQDGAGRQDVDVLEEGLRREVVLEGEVLDQRGRIELGRHGAAGEHGFDLAAERQEVRSHRIVQRLDAVAITRQMQRVVPGVVQPEREHAVQASHTLGAELLPRVEQDLGVGAGPEDVAARDELVAQLAIVVDLAVVGQPIAMVRAGHRLVAIRAEIDDRQPAMAQGQREGLLGDLVAVVAATEDREVLVVVREALVGELGPRAAAMWVALADTEVRVPCVIRPAVREHVGHPADRLRVDRPLGEAGDASDAAHG